MVGDRARFHGLKIEPRGMQTYRSEVKASRRSKIFKDMLVFEGQCWPLHGVSMQCVFADLIIT